MIPVRKTKMFGVDYGSLKIFWVFRSMNQNGGYFDSTLSKTNIEDILSIRLLRIFGVSGYWEYSEYPGRKTKMLGGDTGSLTIFWVFGSVNQNVWQRRIFPVYRYSGYSEHPFIENIPVRRILKDILNIWFVEPKCFEDENVLSTRLMRIFWVSCYWGYSENNGSKDQNVSVNTGILKICWVYYNGWYSEYPVRKTTMAMTDISSI